ncbi:glycosyltransferase [Acinetobacter sp. CAAS 2-6]|uniref:glycosyltransferase n=1 Tax=Acinetobacter sp. CAAS 2-6 TaxID=3016358 RepID=UPI002DD65F59|nr:glycosyltransferase [Acinetobacter sp. CAAS 2-6]
MFKETFGKNSVESLSYKNTIFMFPSTIVGGHELMAIQIIKDIIGCGGKVTVCYNRSLNCLENIFLNLNLDIIDIPFSTQKLEIFHAYFNYFLINKAIKFLKDIDKKFDTIILVQGDIELGSIYSHAANIINCKIISYIPYTHTAKTRNKFLAPLRDFLGTLAYQWCNNYITIYNKAALDIKKYNDKANVKIIKNKVRNLDVFKLKIKDYDKDKSIFKIFIIGRVYFSHKGHDRLLEVLKRLDENLIRKIELNIIGDGPDLDEFKILASNIKKLTTVYWGWMSEPWDEAYKADLIVIPSRYEGVPLVMLEALALNINIIASNVDGMVDYIDKNKLFSDNTTFLEILGKEIK